jgi:hypothetical protein
MLTDDERRQIEVEEVTAARAELTRTQDLQRQLARAAYRREVRSLLRPGRRLLVAGACTLLLAGGLLLALWPRSPEAPDDTSGGIATSELMTRCEAQVRAQVPQDQLDFPPQREADAQITASPEGKRWDGAFTRPGRAGSDFSCEYTIATDQISAQIITP